MMSMLLRSLLYGIKENGAKAIDNARHGLEQT